VELNGALSNPQGVLEIWHLLELRYKALSRKRAPKGFKRHLAPRTYVPLLATITQVFELANYQPMRVKDIHKGCEELLGRTVSYRSLKASLNKNSRNGSSRFARWDYGTYRLGVTSPSDLKSGGRVK